MSGRLRFATEDDVRRIVREELEAFREALEEARRDELLSLVLPPDLAGAPILPPNAEP